MPLLAFKMGLPCRNSIEGHRYCVGDLFWVWVPQWISCSRQLKETNILQRLHVMWKLHKVNSLICCHGFVGFTGSIFTQGHSWGDWKEADIFGLQFHQRPGQNPLSRRGQQHFSYLHQNISLLVHHRQLKSILAQLQLEDSRGFLLCVCILRLHPHEDIFIH